MTDINKDSVESSDELSADERAAIFAASNTRVDRAAAFRTGRVPIPPKALAWTAAVILFLGIGGIVGQHYFPSFSGKTAPTSIAKTTLSTTTTSPSSPNTITSLEVFMGLKFIGTASAKNFSLKTQSGKPWNLASQKGKVVVLAFYSSTCNDICPVVGAEIKQASEQLGKYSSRVEFVVVNTNPRQTRVSSDSAALKVPGITDSPAITFLSGSLSQLNSVWTTYGISIKVGAKANQISHNNALYFIGPEGNLAAFSKPFATESSSGKFSLDAASIRRYAEGIAAAADSLFQ